MNYCKVYQDYKLSCEKSGRYDNVHLIPRILKIVINMGVGFAIKNTQLMDKVIDDITNISGQKPYMVKARKSVSNFSLHEGVVCGLKVTLRSSRMYDFLYRFIELAIPQINSFNGFKRSCINGGNCVNIGIRDASIFPEFTYGNQTVPLGITIVSNTNSKDGLLELMNAFQFPFAIV